MGSFANTVFSIMLGWLQALVSMIWSALTTKEGETLFQYIGNNWIAISVLVCAIGLIADFLVYFFRWAPYKVWRTFFRRLRGDSEGRINSPENEIQTDSTGGNSKYRRKRYFYDPEDTGEQEFEFKRENSEPVKEENFEPDDLFRWREKETREPVMPAEITKAGYSVPQDSPYRKPESKQRRRRIRINLLGDNEENGEIHYYSPKPMIDRKEAYHAPVYPEKWTGSRNQE